MRVYMEHDNWIDSPYAGDVLLFQASFLDHNYAIHIWYAIFCEPKSITHFSVLAVFFLFFTCVIMRFLNFDKKNEEGVTDCHGCSRVEKGLLSQDNWAHWKWNWGKTPLSTCFWKRVGLGDFSDTKEGFTTGQRKMLRVLELLISTFWILSKI